MNIYATGVSVSLGILAPHGVAILAHSVRMKSRKRLSRVVTDFSATHADLVHGHTDTTLPNAKWQLSRPGFLRFSK